MSKSSVEGINRSDDEAFQSADDEDEHEGKRNGTGLSKTIDEGMNLSDDDSFQMSDGEDDNEGKRNGVETSEFSDEYMDPSDDECFKMSDDEEDVEDTVSQEMEETENGKKYWIPTVSEDITPKLGLYFPNDASAEEFYKNYAANAGFHVRLSNKKRDRLGKVTMLYYYCSKEGVSEAKRYNSLEAASGSRKRRNTNYKRTECKASMRIHFVRERNRYEVFRLVEWHNHMLANQEEMRYSLSNRKLNYQQQRNVFHSINTITGVTKGQRIMDKLKGGVNQPGGTVRDCQNYRRDMNIFVGEKDAQMLINTMDNRRKVCPEYFFEYKCDEKKLRAVFWADETARMNYKNFGDVISFDATYRTNKHAMIFVPFVAIDNHKKTVVVGAALIRSESIPDFTWVLKAFIKVPGKQPKFVLTDQCAAMKQAIPVSFPDSKHRLCMWHIIKKIEERIGSKIKLNTPFVSEMKDLVWNVNLEPEVFTISHKNHESEVIANYKVVQNISNGTVDCSYNLFVQNGILCRHSLKVLLNNEVSRIPEKYILRRWRRDLVPVEWLPAAVRYNEVDIVKEKLIGDMQLIVEDVVDRARNDNESLQSFVEHMRAWKPHNKDEPQAESSRQRKFANMEEFYGVAQPVNVDVLPPTGIRNKGCGTGKRLTSQRERAAKKASKPKRICRKCGKLARHDSRNCPDK